jgi:hypothetical protein
MDVLAAYRRSCVAVPRGAVGRGKAARGHLLEPDLACLREDRRSLPARWRQAHGAGFDAEGAVHGAWRERGSSTPRSTATSRTV